MPWGIVGFYTTSTGALDCQREDVFMLGVGNAVGEWLWNDRDEETEDGVDKESYVSKVVDVQFWILTNV